MKSVGNRVAIFQRFLWTSPVSRLRRWYYSRVDEPINGWSVSQLFRYLKKAFMKGRAGSGS